MTYSAFIALLHRCLGPEVGSYFLETLFKTFNQFYTTNDNRASKNSIQFFSFLYNLRVGLLFLFLKEKLFNFLILGLFLWIHL